MYLKPPLILLGYGEYAQTKKLLSVHDDTLGGQLLPVFTDPERAELYRQYMNQYLLQSTLPIAVGGPIGVDMQDYKSPHHINALVAATNQQATDLLELVMIAGKVFHLVVDPPVPSAQEPVEVLELERALEQLRDHRE